MAEIITLDEPFKVPSDAQLLQNLVAAAIERTHHVVRYDSAYVGIPYLNGDVPAGTGSAPMKLSVPVPPSASICKKEIHQNMEHNLSAYPRRWQWSQSGTDPNIDHRRVPNLMVFFSRKGESLPVTAIAADYRAGNLVTWDLANNVPHIGIVVDQRSRETGHYLVVHNIGRGPQMEDVLFRWKVTGHYRYYGPQN